MDAVLDRNGFARAVEQGLWTPGPIAFDARSSEIGPHIARSALDWEERRDSVSSEIRELLYDSALRWHRRFSEVHSVTVDDGFVFHLRDVEVLLPTPSAVSATGVRPIVLLLHLAEHIGVNVRSEGAVSSTLEKAVPRELIRDVVDRMLGGLGVELVVDAQVGRIYPVLFAELPVEELERHPARRYLTADETAILIAREQARGRALVVGDAKRSAWEALLTNARTNTVVFGSVTVSILSKAAMVAVRPSVDPFPAGRLYASTLWADMIMLARLESLVLDSISSVTRKLAREDAEIRPEVAAKLQRSVLAFKTTYARSGSVERSAGGRLLASMENELRNGPRLSDIAADVDQIVSVASLQTDGEERRFATFATGFASVLLPAQLAPQVLSWLGVKDGGLSIEITLGVTVTTFLAVFAVRYLSRRGSTARRGESNR